MRENNFVFFLLNEVLNVGMNEGQGQIDAKRAEDKWLNWMSNGDSEQMKAKRQGKFIFITHLIHKGN